MLTVNEAEFTKVWKQATATTLICLDVEGTKYNAFIKDTEYDIISNKNLHVDFHAVDDNQKIRRVIKIQTTGTPVGVREGGFLLTTGASVKIECTPKYLPVRIVADIDALKIGDSLKIKDLNLAKEWAVDKDRDGYSNKYALDTQGLTILDLSKTATVLHWITVLLQNRVFNLRDYIEQ